MIYNPLDVLVPVSDCPCVASQFSSSLLVRPFDSAVSFPLVMIGEVTGDDLIERRRVADHEQVFPVLEFFGICLGVFAFGLLSDLCRDDRGLVQIPLKA
jgi:hypothetical protein